MMSNSRMTAKQRPFTDITFLWPTLLEGKTLYSHKAIIQIARRMRQKTNKLSEKIGEPHQTNYILLAEHYDQNGQPYQHNPNVIINDITQQPGIPPSKPAGIYCILAHDIPSTKEFTLWTILRTLDEKLILGSPGTSGYVKLAVCLYHQRDKKIVHVHNKQNAVSRLTTVKYFHPIPLFDTQDIVHEKNQIKNCCNHYRLVTGLAALGYKRRINENGTITISKLLLTNIPPGIALHDLRGCFELIRERYALHTSTRVFNFIQSLVHNILDAYQETILKKKLLHNDIKPNNIIITNKHAKICFIDCDKATPQYPPPQPGVRGAIMYLAPELLTPNQETPPTEASEVYALGATLANLSQFGEYQEIKDQALLTQWRAYYPGYSTLYLFQLYDTVPEQDTFWDYLCYAKIREQYSQYRKAVFKLVCKMMSHDPHQRPTVAQAIETHRRIQADLTTSAIPHTAQHHSNSHANKLAGSNRPYALFRNPRTVRQTASRSPSNDHSLEPKKPRF